MNDIITSEWVTLFNHHACYSKEKDVLENDNVNVAIEAVKALFNIIFNSNVTMVMVSKSETPKGILERIKTKK